MLYQNILKETAPYCAFVSTLDGFAEHRHADVELHFPLTGEFDVLLEKKQYRVRRGDLLVISPMISHAFPTETETNGRRVLTVMFGISLLKEHFALFNQLLFPSPVLSLSEGGEHERELLACLREIATHAEMSTDMSELLLRGSLYRLAALLLGLLKEIGTEAQRDLRTVANVDRALDLIDRDYAHPLTVEDAARATGYGKSNFCKIFKSITGETFHTALNRRRVERACALLSQTDLPIGEIAHQVGFGEAKTLCRVFREQCGITPGAFRKQKA